MKTTIFILSAFILAGCTPTGQDMSPRMLGKMTAKVLIEEFSDVQCPACGIIGPEVEKFVRENPDLARLEYYHFPLSYHPYAFSGAEASECAGDQGQFFEYIGILYNNQNSLSEDFFLNVANSLKLDIEQFEACLKNQDHKAKILSHMAEAKRRGLPGTPTLYVNGEMVRWSGAETFKAFLENL